jgi:RNA polymerase sigma factor (TIGR02999 family)
MRQIVIDEARARGAAKRGGPAAPAPLDEVVVAAPAAEVAPEELLALDGALAELETSEPRLGRVVEWHFFGGLTFAEIGEALGVTERTVLRDWRAARALLHGRLASGT